MKMDFIVIGAAKCGTTALHDMLQAQPEISVPKKKDFHYFDYDENYKKGERWYLSHFCDDHEEKIRGEVAANYIHSSVALRRIEKDLGKDVKVIVLLRDPLSRLISEYEHHRRNGTLKRSLTYYLSNQNAPSENRRYSPWSLLVERSEYSRLLPMVENMFVDVQLIKSEELRSNHHNELERLCKFIGAHYSEIQAKESNRGYSPRFSTVVRLMNGNGSFKKLFKLIFPSYSMRRKVRRLIKKVNSSNETKTFVTEKEKKMAAKILKNEIIFFEQLSR